MPCPSFGHVSCVTCRSTPARGAVEWELRKLELPPALSPPLFSPFRRGGAPFSFLLFAPLSVRLFRPELRAGAFGEVRLDWSGLLTGLGPVTGRLSERALWEGEGGEGRRRDSKGVEDGLDIQKKKKFERTRGCASWTGSLPPEARPEGLRCTQRRFRSTRLADPASCSRTLSKFLISWSPRLPRLGAVPCSIRGVLLQHSCGRAGAAPRGSKACAPTPPLDVQVRGAQGGTDRTGRHS